MTESKRQLEALRRFYHILWLTLFTGRDARQEFPEMTRDERRELCAAGNKAGTLIADVRRELLQSGYAVPDHWLTVRLQGNVGRVRTLMTDTTYIHALDGDAIRRIKDEVSAAIQRMEAGASTPGTASPTMQTCAEAAKRFHRDRETIKKWCQQGRLVPQPTKSSRNEWLIDPAAKLVKIPDTKRPKWRCPDDECRERSAKSTRPRCSRHKCWMIPCRPPAIA